MAFPNKDELKDYLKMLEEAQKRDVKKIEFCELNQIQLIEIFPNDELSKEYFENLGVYL